MLREKIQRFHFVGIGGIGMSGIARILLEMGYKVSGSDLRENDRTEELRRLGAKIHIGHSEDNVKDAQVIVYSSAVSESNPEIKKGKELGIPVIPRGEMLAELFRMKEGIAVSGTHGKTTTTSMLAYILQNSGYDPTVIIGGVLQSIESNARLGRGSILISEADESDGSFLKLFPVVAVVTNIDREHLDFYGNIEAVKKAFLDFTQRVPFYGFSALNADDKGCRDILPKISRKVVTFGISSPATVQAKNLRVEEGRYVFEVSYECASLGTIHLGVPGRYNVYNALAATAVALELGVNFKVIKNSLESFKNAHRRLELKGRIAQIPVYDDYGHHPTEIGEVIKTLREIYKDRRIVLVFQPHRYSRTHMLFDDFVRVLKEADLVFVTDIYTAGEENKWNVKAVDLANASSAFYVRDKETLFLQLTQMLRDTDVVVFVGAGSISKWCEEFVSSFQVLSDRLP